MTKHFLVVAKLAILLLVGCGAPSATPSATPVAPTAMPTSTPANVHSVEHQLIFDAAWQTVNDKYFDPTFGGKDWQAIGDEYRQKLTTIQDDETFWLQVLNPMLFELGVSHLFALPAEMAGEIDTLSEEFAGSLQALGRATIIGTQTQGSCLVMNVEFLPGDAILIYPYKQSQTPSGRILEGNGVVPDIEVVLERDLLLQGKDSQLDAALAFLEQ